MYLRGLFCTIQWDLNLCDISIAIHVCEVSFALIIQFSIFFQFCTHQYVKIRVSVYCVIHLRINFLKCNLKKGAELWLFCLTISLMVLAFSSPYHPLFLVRMNEKCFLSSLLIFHPIKSQKPNFCGRLNNSLSFHITINLQERTLCLWVRFFVKLDNEAWKLYHQSWL